jgi:acid phosphatase type 7
MRITKLFLVTVIFLTGCVGAVREPPLPGEPPLPQTEPTLQPASPDPAQVEPTETALPSATATAVPTATATPLPSPTPTVTPAVLVGAGDIAVCGEPWDEATADLLDEIEGTIFAVGDVVQDRGRAIEFERCFDPSWGRHKERIRPAPGNHDYYTPGAEPYYDYFGAAAGERGKGYYHYTLGDWLIIVLNSNCDDVSCRDGSPQVEWLRQTLADNPTKCALAYFHHPRWSSGPAGSSGWMAPFWRALYEHGADIVISGHDHHYERFVLQDPQGNLDLQAGMRQFVVGTGGGYLRAVTGAPIANSEVIGQWTFGVLKLELFPEHYTWEFIPVEGMEFRDAGEDVCRW